MDLERFAADLRGYRDAWYACRTCHRQQVNGAAPSCIEKEAEVLAEYQRRTGRRRPINEAGLNRLCIGCRVLLSLSDAAADIGVMVIAAAGRKPARKTEGPKNG